jgi:hypothetical protein
MKTLMILLLLLICSCSSNKTQQYSETTNIPTDNSVHFNHRISETDKAIEMEMFEIGYFLAIKGVQDGKIHVFNSDEILHQFSIDSLWAQKNCINKY